MTGVPYRKKDIPEEVYVAAQKKMYDAFPIHVFYLCWHLRGITPLVIERRPIACKDHRGMVDFFLCQPLFLKPSLKKCCLSLLLHWFPVATFKWWHLPIFLRIEGYYWLARLCSGRDLNLQPHNHLWCEAECWSHLAMEQVKAVFFSNEQFTYSWLKFGLTGPSETLWITRRRHHGTIDLC